MLGFVGDILTLVGTFLGLASVALAFVTFFSPTTIQNFALRNPRQWIRVPSINRENRTYRHKLLSGFTIEVDLSEPVQDNFDEPWMKVLHRPDRVATSHYVTLFFNGLPLDRLLFLQYDADRNFIPVPIITRVDNKIYVSFSSKQEQFANVVGYDHFGRNFYEVANLITRSRFNPYFLEVPETDLQERLQALDKRIHTFKLRLSAKKN